MPYQLPSFLYDIPRSLPLAIGLPLLGGSINGRVTRSAIESWYPTLKQPPPGPPPKWVFPVVWTSLYAGMGWASHIAVTALDRSPSPAIRAAASSALLLYYTQLALNTAWTPLFFGAKRTGLALVDILGLWGSVVATGVKMAEVDRRTLFVFVPYVAWVTYATYLNAGIWWLNSGEQKYGKDLKDLKDKSKDLKDKGKGKMED